MGKKIEHFQRNTFQQHLTYIIKTWVEGAIVPQT